MCNQSSDQRDSEEQASPTNRQSYRWGFPASSTPFHQQVGHPWQHTAEATIYSNKRLVELHSHQQLPSSRASSTPLSVK
jgi:hypothetical protein